MSGTNKKSGKQQLLMRGIESDSDRREALETIMRSFSNPRRMENHLEDSLWQGAIFNPEHTRVVVADGRVASVVVMVPRSVRFGPVRVPAMTIGPVGTHDGFQKRGLSSAAMNDTTTYMEENGILIAYLRGIQNFYHKFGYYPSQVDPRVNLVRSNLVREMLPGYLKPMTRKDIPRVAKLYEKATSNQFMSSQRDKKLWNWLLGPGGKSWIFAGPHLILDAKDRLCGYLLIEPNYGVVISEIVVKKDENAMRATLGALVKIGKEREKKEVGFPLAFDDPFALFIRQEVGGQFVLNSRAISGPMVKIINFPLLMKHLGPMFNQYWKDSCSNRPACNFTLTSNIGSATFSISKGKVTVGGAAKGMRVKLPQKYLTGLITGYYSIDELAWRKGVAVPEKLIPVLNILFPKKFAFNHRADNY